MPKHMKYALGKFLTMLDYVRAITCNLIITTPIESGLGIARRLRELLKIHIIVYKTRNVRMIPGVGVSRTVYSMVSRSEIYDQLRMMLRKGYIKVTEEPEHIPECFDILQPLWGDMYSVRRRYIKDTISEIVDIVKKYEEGQMLKEVEKRSRRKRGRKKSEGIEEFSDDFLGLAEGE